MTYTSILVEDVNEIRTVVLNRPERRNAMTPTMQSEIIAAMESAQHSSVRALVFGGAGQAFCAGLDLDVLRTSSTGEQTLREDAERLAHMFRTLYELPIPTIAAVNGPAIAGGTGLATLCDFTIATPEAKFGYTEARIGFVPAIVSVFLNIQIGEKRCRDLLVSGRIFTAQEAYHLGLVNQIVEPDQLADSVRTLSSTLIRNSPKSIASIKRLLASNTKEILDVALSRAIDESVASRKALDFQEGITAFFEKRDPRWPK
jgi:methylglutaconyl-CoA hydratase